MLPLYSGTCGAAFLLQSPSSSAHTIKHSAGTVYVRSGAPYVTIARDGAVAAEMVREKTWESLQEALDVHAARTRVPLATKREERESLIWRQAASGFELTYLDTADLAYSVSSSGVVAGAAPLPAAAPQFAHHPALRFYRLSQLSDDLFDGYRNAYLSLECLVSGETRKARREPELDWLKRVISAHFAGALPGGMDLNSTLDEVYLAGRLPLFHAKQGETFYEPQGQERQRIQILFEKLTLLLVSLLGHKLGHEAVYRWGDMSQAVYDAQSRKLLEFDSIILRDRFCRLRLKPQLKVIQEPRRFGNLWAQATVRGPFRIGSVDRVETRFTNERRLQFSLAESIPLKAVNSFTLELNVRHSHARAPRFTHST